MLKATMVTERGSYTIMCPAIPPLEQEIGRRQFAQRNRFPGAQEAHNERRKPKRKRGQRS